MWVGSSTKYESQNVFAADLKVVGDDFEVKYLRIELEGLQVEVIDVGERVRGLEWLMVSVALIHPSNLDLGMCWLTSLSPNLLNLLRICLL